MYPRHTNRVHFSWTGSDGRRHTVLDTKYKQFNGKPKQSDLYQMIAYCNSLRLQDAILIYPGAGRIQYRRRFHGFDVGALNLDLDGDLESFRRHCLTFAQRLARVATVDAESGTARSAAIR